MRVTFTDAKGRVYFGETVDPQKSDKAAKLAKKGLSLIVDAVTPEKWEFPTYLLKEVPLGRFDPNLGSREGEHDDPMSQYREKAFDAAWEASQAARGRMVLGAMFRIGMAFYMVTEIKGRQCLVEHRQFTETVWMDDRFKEGGWFAVTEIATYIKATYSFSKPETAKR